MCTLVVRALWIFTDNYIRNNQDWDPCYLRRIFDKNFDNISELWLDGVEDSVLLKEMENYEHYCLIVEDISLDDDELCSAVEIIEYE